MALPAELDFDERQPFDKQRLDRAMEWIAAKVRQHDAFQPSWEAAVNELRAFGLARLDDAVQPVYDRLTAIAQLGIVFTASSGTTLAVGTGIKVLELAEDDRGRFAAAAYLAVQKAGDPDVAMWGPLVGYDRMTGLLTIDVEHVLGTGSGAEWLVSASVNPNALHEARTDNPHGVTAAQVGAPTVGAMTAELALKADAAAMTSALATKADAAATTAALAAKAATARSIGVGGLATGGGDLTADRVVDVPAASKAEAEAGTDNAKAMTPLRVDEAIAYRLRGRLMPEKFGATGIDGGNDTAAWVTMLTFMQPGYMIELRPGAVYCLDDDVVQLPNVTNDYRWVSMACVAGMATIKARTAGSALIAPERWHSNNANACGPWRFANIIFDGAGIADYPVVPYGYHWQFHNCDFRNPKLIGCFQSRYTKDGTTLSTSTLVNLVLQHCRPGAPKGWVEAKAGNVGNGTLSDLVKGDSIYPGRYTVTFSSATAFSVVDPTGTTIGSGTVGSPFSATVNLRTFGFQITAGGTAFVAGDAIYIGVTAQFVSWGASNNACSDGYILDCESLGNYLVGSNANFADYSYWIMGTSGWQIQGNHTWGGRINDVYLHTLYVSGAIQGNYIEQDFVVGTVVASNMAVIGPNKFRARVEVLFRNDAQREQIKFIAPEVSTDWLGANGSVRNNSSQTNKRIDLVDPVFEAAEAQALVIGHANARIYCSNPIFESDGITDGVNDRRLSSAPYNYTDYETGDTLAAGPFWEHRWRGGNASGTRVTWARQIAGIVTATAGAEDGFQSWEVMKGGVMTAALRADSFGTWVGKGVGQSIPGVGPLGLHVNGDSFATSGQHLARYSADADGPWSVWYKSRGATVGTHTIANSGDVVGRQQARIYDGSTSRPIAEMRAEVDGTPGASDAPGRWVWLTTADGAASGSESARLDNAGTPYWPRIGTTASAANAFLNSGSTPANALLRSTSSGAYKRDVEDVEPAYVDAVIKRLRPVWYRSTAAADPSDWSWYGLIAEEVAEVDPRLVHWGYHDDDWEDVEETSTFRETIVEKIDGETVRREIERTDTVIRRQLKPGAVKKPDGVMYDRLAVLLLAHMQRQPRVTS